MNTLKRLTPRLLLAFNALCLATGGTVHALAFPKAAIVADHSTLPPFFAAGFKDLWLRERAGELGHFVRKQPCRVRRPGRTDNGHKLLTCPRRWVSVSTECQQTWPR
jgi:hypothetical protein